MMRITHLFVAGVVFGVPWLASAQDGRGFRGFGGFSDVDGLKSRLGSTDEEWKVLGAAIRRVAMSKQVVEVDRTGLDSGTNSATPADNFRDRRGGRGGGFGGGFGGGGQGGQGGRPGDDRGGRGPRGGGFGGPGAATGGGDALPPPPGDFRPDAPPAPPVDRDAPGRRPEGRPADQPSERGGPTPPGGPAVNGPPAGGFGPPPGGGLGPPPGGGFGAPGVPSFGGGGGFGRGGPDLIAVAIAELQAVLADPKSTPEQIKIKVEAVREAKDKVAKELAAAREELRLLVTPDQEAILVSQGYLE